MINGKDKNIGGTKMRIPPPPSREELKFLPKYIAYKAALLREKLVLTYVIATLMVLFAVHFAVTRFEISNLYEQLRTKEYILAPGVQDFTTVSPQSVPDDYISN
ncbi:MAG: hypothetical protein HYW48_12080 [Deltaproteobacteria bacterium]|nr:hypothetical protein [Deltaproteobacteria bacterium]